MRKANLFLMIALLFFGTYIIKAEEKAELLIAPVQMGPNCNFIEADEAKEALESVRYAINLTENYHAIDTKTIDSVLKKRSSFVNTLTLSDIAKASKADYIVFTSTKRIGNIIRSEIIMKSPKDSTVSKKGTGYAMLNFRDKLDGKIVFVPSLIASYQRAFAVAVNDTMIYDSYDNAYRVYPAPALAICGIEFIDSDNAKKWELFRTKQSASYDITETIFEVAIWNKRYFTYDIPSRDSIYAVFGMYEKLNFNAPTDLELEALRRFDVEYLISGALSFDEESGFLQIELFLFQFTEGRKTKIVASHKELIEADKVGHLRYGVKKAAVRLLFGADTEIPFKIKEDVPE